MSGVLDLEWDGNDPRQRLLVLGWKGMPYPANAIPQGVFDDLTDPTQSKVVFSKEDHLWLHRHGVPVVGDIIDVQTMAWCYDERTPLTLAWCVEHYLGKTMDKRVVRKGGKVLFRTDEGDLVLIGEAPIDQLLQYNAGDLWATEELWTELWRRLKDTGQLEYWEQMHQPFTQVLIDMELRGLPIDVRDTRQLQQELRVEEREAYAGLKRSLDLPDEFNLASPEQMALLLYTKEFELPARVLLTREDMAKVKEGEWVPALPLNFDVQKLGRDYAHGVFQLKGLGLTPHDRAPKCMSGMCGHDTSGDCRPSTSSKSLVVYHSKVPWVRDLVDWRMKVKTLQFLDKFLLMQRDGRIHARFNQTGTATGRLSSSDPNLQNVPARGDLGMRVRSLFRPEQDHVFIVGDYSQIEPRLMAHFSEDPVMLDTFYKGGDIYEVTTEALLGQRFEKGTPERQLVKGNMLAMSYGAQPRKIRRVLAEQGYVFPLKRVEIVWNEIRDLYHVFWTWAERTVEEAAERGYIETIAGHRRHLDFHEENRWKAERQAVNSKIQGSAADIVQAAMLDVASELPQLELLAQVHDELVFEVYEREASLALLARLREYAEEPLGIPALKVRVVFEPKICYSWADK